ncbi:solute carrier family 41 member 1-like protein [Dinothrombium tinctorium]|uniref:Solute carrier family 41 member 1-like protein n=1 Tax=Dinothrombium tinctorium TaxID=1965070 RepID=A0A3S3NUH7_9ACAR|nr:solute carrier family 41 member 1-like protein [Dinothrombium tinctorium]RWS06669.1 solute carrier family 41 member 1-like protein [Dinothrombium tinctorium]RWS06671.1 solute carrier family 41 member 1-like protein [Dinothrombium tinctorium]
MVPQQKSEEIDFEEEMGDVDCDQFQFVENVDLTVSQTRPHFSQSEKANLVNLIYDEETYDKTIDEDSDDDWERINSGNNAKIPLINHGTVAFKKENDKVYLKKFADAENYDLEITIIDENESLLSTMIQVFIPFLIAGFGTVGAGLVLDTVQHWDVFRNISEVFILVPALLGLKGNLEMTLASRISTQANLGNLKSVSEQWKITSGNIALTQCQAIVVGFLAALFAVVIDWLPEGEFNFNHALLLCASSLLTASIASFILGLLMILVVIWSHKCHINPDNIATPIAASLGDLTTLALLAHISNMLYFTIDTSLWLCVVLILVFLMLIPVWCVIAVNNKYTSDVLYTGWLPVICAMSISSIGGCILDFAVSRFKGIAVFQPVINGVGGNLVAVQSSRISTYLHRRNKLGTLPKDDSLLCISPCAAFFGKNIHAKTACLLLLMVVPGHLIFSFGIKLLQAGHTTITVTFLIVYLLAALLQVFLLLYFAHVMIFWMWSQRIDPDNSAIPYLTAIGDLLGTGFLAIAFLFLYTIGDKDGDVGD